MADTPRPARPAFDRWSMVERTLAVASSITGLITVFYGLTTPAQLFMGAAALALLVVGWRLIDLRRHALLDRRLVGGIVVAVASLIGLVVVTEHDTDADPAGVAGHSAGPESRSSTSGNATSTIVATTTTTSPVSGEAMAVDTGRLELPADNDHVDLDAWEPVSDDAGGVDVMLADGVLSAINGSRLARSTGEAYDDCRAITSWRSSIGLGEDRATTTEADRPLVPGDYLCVRTTGGHVVGLRAHVVAPLGESISISGTTWPGLPPGRSVPG